MVSDLFMKDYKAMTAAGVVFTPEDVVRLNALAVKVRLSKDPCRGVCLPRAVFMPRDSVWRAPIVFREPTLGHEMWLERVVDDAEGIGGVDQSLVYAYALSREVWELPDPSNRRRTFRKIYRFARRLAAFTRAQLEDALGYALHGADWTAGEVEPAPAGDDDDDAVRPSPSVGCYVEAIVHGVHLSLEDAKRMTASEIHEVIMRRLVEERKVDASALRNRAFAAYVRARDEIRKRLI